MKEITVIFLILTIVGKVIELFGAFVDKKSDEYELMLEDELEIVAEQQVVTDVDTKIETLVKKMQNKHELELLLEATESLSENSFSSEIATDSLFDREENAPGDVDAIDDEQTETTIWDIEDDVEGLIATPIQARPHRLQHDKHKKTAYTQSGLRQALRWQMILERPQNRTISRVK